MKIFRILIVLLLLPTYVMAGVCDTAWDGDKVVTAIGSRPTYMRIPLKDKQQQISEVTVGQIQAFSEAKNRIVRITGLSPTFLICGDAAPNAFATKGSSGDVVGVTIGMVKLVDGDVDMAAAVIGHEMAHHTHNHGAVGAGRDAMVGIAGLILGMVVDNRSQRRTGVPTNVGQTFGQIGATLVSRKFSRDQEREADSTGFQYMVTAGFNPNGAIRLAERMNRSGGGSSGLFFDSHPGWGERGELFQTFIARSPQAQQIIARSNAPSPLPIPAGSQARVSTETVAFAPTYTTTDAQKSFTAGLTAYRSGDIVNGLREFRSAAEAGYAPAQVAVGYFYREGKGGLPKDEVEALRLYQLAADQGLAQAQDNLALMYARGRVGLPQDDVEAVRLFRLAADQGFAPSQSNLGFAYATGLGGLPKDDVEAVRLYRLAADQGGAHGQAMLAVMYGSGRGGLPKDDVEAVRLLGLAASKGQAIGQASLGFAYENGRGGLTKDLETAVKWYRLAAQQGNTGAIASLKRLGR